jgi:flagellar basal body-associated protein FliL
MFITASPPSGPATHSSLLLKAIFGVVAVIVIAAVVAAVLMLRKSKTKENKESRN